MKASYLDSFLRLYINSMLETLSNYDYNDAVEGCLNYDLADALLRTSHVVKATAVAWGAGFCIYAARLTTAIGAKRVISENIPGKGNNVHKLLAVASLDVLDRWRRGGGVDANSLRDIIKNSISELDDILQIRNEVEKGELEKKAFNMLGNLVEILPQALRKLGIDHTQIKDLRYYTELELIDYTLHVWGVPDLIIEHPTTRKAIVVEWKSDEGSPTEAEKYQVYIYTVLEAIRLGLGETFDDVVNAIAPDDVANTRILPIIIRPNYAYSDHPLFPISGGRTYRPADVQTLRERLKRIVITSHYLTLLLMDIDSLLYGVGQRRDSQVSTTQERCVAKHRGSGRPFYIFRMTPAELFLHSGRPRNQQAGYPCSVCPFSDRNSKLRECSFYFGSFDKDRLDKLMWLYRFKVYRERDRDLLMYKALYMASKLRGLKLQDFGRRFGNSLCGLSLDLESHTISESSCNKARKKICGKFEVKFEKFDVNTTARIGVYDIVNVDEEQYSELIFLKRKLLPCEIAGREEIPYLAPPRQRYPVLITLIEDHVVYPTLGTSLFGRVEKVLLLGERDEDLGVRCGEDEVCVVVAPISRYLRLPFKVFKRYVNMFNITRALVTEVGADLTSMDLATLHALHMALKMAQGGEALGELRDISEDERLSIMSSVEEALKEAFSMYSVG